MINFATKLYLIYIFVVELWFRMIYKWWKICYLNFIGIELFLVKNWSFRERVYRLQLKGLEIQRLKVKIRRIGYGKFIGPWSHLKPNCGRMWSMSRKIQTNETAKSLCTRSRCHSPKRSEHWLSDPLRIGL